MNNKITAPYQTFFDTRGNALEGGMIYIGVENLNPETDPVAVFYDEALTIAADQPLRTAGGRIFRNGSPADVFVSGRYSITVRDAGSVIVATKPSEGGSLPTEYDTRAELVTALPSLSLQDGEIVWAAGLAYRYSDGASTISDLPNLEPVLPLNVKHWNVTGDGSTDDATGLTEAMSGGDRDIYVPEGTYLCESYVRLYQDTTIRLHPDATMQIGLTNNRLFINGPNDGSNYATEYNGDGNITVTGGKYFCDAGNRVSGSAQCSYFKLGHAQQVHLSNLVFVDNWRGHYIEINAIRNGTVRDSTFSGQVLDGSEERDAINVDSMFPGNFTEFGAYDETSCDNIIIEGNFFDGIQSLGTHNADAATHKNIHIQNNRFENVTQVGVFGAYWTGGSVKGNYMDGVDNKAIELDNCNGIDVSGNTLLNINTNATTRTHAIQLDTCSGCYVNENDISSGGTSNYEYAIRSFGGTALNEIKTIGADAGNSGIVDANDSDIIDGWFRLIMVDDSAKTVLPPLDNQGRVKFSTRSGAAGAVKGSYFFRSNAEEMDLIATVSGSTEETGVGVLTGTTGTDGVMTVSSANDGLIYIENRTGSDKTTWISFS